MYVLGGPGCGKGTNCAKLKEEFGFVHLSAGDLLRAEQKREGSAEAAMIAACIKEGKIVPAEVTITLLRRAMDATPDATFLIDGFPRKLDQAKMFEKAVRASPKFVLFFDVSREVMTDRIIERGRTSGRSDDNMEALMKRFDTYQNTSYPVIEYFKKRGLVERVDAAPAVDVVYKKARSLFISPKFVRCCPSSNAFHRSIFLAFIHIVALPINAANMFHFFFFLCIRPSLIGMFT